VFHSPKSSKEETVNRHHNGSLEPDFFHGDDDDLEYDGDDGNLSLDSEDSSIFEDSTTEFDIRRHPIVLGNTRKNDGEEGNVFGDGNDGKLSLDPEDSSSLINSVIDADSPIVNEKEFKRYYDKTITKTTKMTVASRRSPQSSPCASSSLSDSDDSDLSLDNVDSLHH